VEVNKSRNSLSDRMKGSNNGAARVIGFVDFREEIEGGGARIRDMKERDVKGGEILGGTNGLKEREKVLVVGISRVVREKPVSGSIRQLSVSLSKIINLVEDHSGTALVCREDKDVWIGPEGAESLALRWG